MKDVNLILEIERMREMMGTKPLNYNGLKKINEEVRFTTGRLLFESDGGGKGELGTLILKALGFGDEVAGSVGKQAGDEWTTGAKQFAEVLEREGLDDVGKIQAAIARTSNVAKATTKQMEDALGLYFKNNPDIAASILKEIPAFTKSIISNLPLATLIPDAAILQGLRNILTIAPERLGAYATRIDDINAELFRITAIKDAYQSGNADVVKLLDNIDSLARQAEEINLGKGKGKADADIPVGTPVMKPEATKQGKTNAEIKAEEDAAAAVKAEEDAAAQKIKDDEEAERIFQENYNKTIDNFVDNIRKNPIWKKALNWFQSFLNYIGVKLDPDKELTDLARQLKEAKLTPRDLENLDSNPLYTQLLTRLKDKVKDKKGKKGVANRIDDAGKIGESVKKNVCKFIPNTACAIFGGLFTIWLFYYANKLENVNMITSLIGLSVWDFLDNFDPTGKFELEKTEGYCLSEIPGYFDLTIDQRDKIKTTKLSCANVDGVDKTLQATSVVYQEAISAVGADGKNTTKPEGFKVIINGSEVFFPVGGGEPVSVTSSSTGGTNTGGTNTGGTNTGGTNTGGTYTNTKDDFIKWVNEKHPGKYGTEYEWTGNAGFYYPNGGNTGNAMTFSSSGWNK